MSDTRWLEIKAAAAELGKAPRTVRRWRSKHNPPAGLFKPGTGRRLLVDVDLLRAWAESMGLLDREPDGGGPRLTPNPPAASDPPPPAEPDPEEQARIEEDARRRREEEDERALQRMLDAGEDPEKLLALNPEDVRRIARVVELRKKLAEVARQERQNAEHADQLVPRAEVLRWFAAEVAKVHAAFAALPGVLAQRLAGATYEQAYDAIDAELRHVLTSLSEVPDL